MTKLSQLTVTKGIIIARLERLSRYIEGLDFTTPPDKNGVPQIEIRFQKLKDCWDEFNQTQSEIDMLEGSPSSEWDTFEENYFNIYTKYSNIINLIAESNVAKTCEGGSLRSANSPKNQPGAEVQVKLPFINLPTFSGSYDQFASFMELFKSLIHSNTSLPTIQKFHFLKTSLKGDAAALIQSLELSENNYQAALDLLHHRYDNKRILINQHIQSFFNIENIEKEKASSLRHLLDEALKHVRALSSLGEPTDSWDTLLVFILANKLDRASRKAWETNTASSDLSPTFSMFIDFINNRFKILEACENDSNHLSQKSKNNQTSSNGFSPNYPTAPRRASCAVAVDSKGQKLQCCFCKEIHYSYKCPDLIKLPIDERIKLVSKMDVCKNCFWRHKTIDCKSKFSCNRCGKRHNTLLCKSASSQGFPSTSKELKESFRAEPSKVSVAHCSYNSSINQEIILATAVVYMLNSEGKPVPCRVLLDSASQSNFITTAFSKSLGIRQDKCKMSVFGINNNPMSACQSLQATLRSRISSYNVSLNFHIIPKITERLPLREIDLNRLKIPPTFGLADPNFHSPKKIDALIGAEVFWKLLYPEQLKLGRDLPLLQNSRLGWVVTGRLQDHSNAVNPRKSSCFLTVNSCELDQLLTKFWTIEQIGDKKQPSQQELACEQHFSDNYCRDPEGRIYVSLPFKEDPTSLGDSFATAKRRFLSLERRLDSQPELKLKYTEFLNNYIEEGHMELVNHPIRTPSYYLPHHPVFKEGSSTTKLRVVFDASSKTTTGKSLNDILKVGPVIQKDLFNILVNFRFHKYAFIADVKQMFRQVFHFPDDSNFLLIIWRNNKNEPLRVFKLLTVTYGTSSASFLAIRSLHEIANLEGERFPLAAKVVKSDFYVDDVISGSDDLDTALLIQTQLIALLRTGQFELHKWVANHPSLLEAIPPSRQDSNYIVQEEGDESKIKTLGIIWEPDRDIFKFKCSPNSSVDVTKRKILSEISKLYDPLGLVSPIIVKAKLIMQSLWQLKEDWDKPVPNNILIEWETFRNTLTELSSLDIPRHVKGCSQCIDISLHGYSDASEKAYGCAVYIKCTSADGQVASHLLCSKSRVAPLKQQTLPRLELCGALLLAELVHKILSHLEASLSSVNLWTDSSVVLVWIVSDSSRWRTFIANRVAKIQRLTSEYTWNHVRSADNPADILSRGCLPNQLIKNSLWWHGPSWLLDNVIPSSAPPNQEADALASNEGRNIVLNMLSTNEEFNIFSRYSSLMKLIKVTAYCLRYLDRLKKANSFPSISLTCKEYTNALLVLVKMSQSQSFSDDLSDLQANRPLRPASKLIALNPFLDDAGVLRVGGRLTNSDLSYNRKHPCLLPANHPLTHLIANDFHVRLSHAGPQLLLSSMRQEYWPLRGKALVNKIVKKCVLCARSAPRPVQQLMGDLPRSRVLANPPFFTCGVDFFGPVWVKKVLQRGNSQFKAYCALFVCFVTRAIHLEVVTSLSSADFIAALKRFVGRRGLPNQIYCDNATNFIGAKNELNVTLIKLIKNNPQMQSYFLANNITWTFIPPRTPNFGGIWEAGVKSVKTHLKKILNSATLNLQELSTLLIDIEACVNSRPISPMSEDPSDLLPLTPGHFLIGRPLNAIPVANLQDVSIHRLSRWQLTERLRQDFWRRWSSEFLTTLQTRVKWQTATPNIRVGSLVILKDENRPPLSWLMGRITCLHPGPDGLCRVVTVSTQHGTFRRGISKICLLPVETPTEEKNTSPAQSDFEEDVLPSPT